MCTWSGISVLRLRMNDRYKEGGRQNGSRDLVANLQPTTAQHNITILTLHLNSRLETSSHKSVQNNIKQYTKHTYHYKITCENHLFLFLYFPHDTLARLLILIQCLSTPWLAGPRTHRISSSSLRIEPPVDKTRSYIASSLLVLHVKLFPWIPMLPSKAVVYWPWNHKANITSLFLSWYIYIQIAN